jgi:hypothetical protein
MEWRFNGRHGLFLDLAGIMSSFFSLFTFILNLPFKISFISFSATPISGGARSQCLKAAGRDQRWTAGMYRMEWNLKKEHCFTLDDDGLRLHCDKTKKHHQPYSTLVGKKKTSYGGRHG